MGRVGEETGRGDYWRWRTAAGAIAEVGYRDGPESGERARTRERDTNTDTDTRTTGGGGAAAATHSESESCRDLVSELSSSDPVWHEWEWESGATPTTTTTATAATRAIPEYADDDGVCGVSASFTAAGHGDGGELR